MSKGASFAIKALPVIVPAFLLFLTQTQPAVLYNGQPTPPNSIKKYRKF